MKPLAWLVSAAMACGAAHADERQELEALRQTTLGLIQALVQQGFLTQSKADELVRQAAQKPSVAGNASSPGNASASGASPSRPEPGVIRVPYVPESVKKQIADQVREEVVAQAKAERWGDANAVPEWVDRVKVEGELRVGLQVDTYGSGNAASAQFLQSNGQNINDMLGERDRLRLRARLGVNAKVTPELSTVLRLTTGSNTDPTSTSQTLGNTANKYNFALDRAYLRYHDDMNLPWLTVTAGRMPNPWFSTDLVWNENLSFEGVAVSIDPAAKSNAEWRPFLGAGLFPIQEIELTRSNKAPSKWLYGAQAGLEWLKDNSARAKLGLAYYDFQNITGQLNPSATQTDYDQTAPAFRQKGNTLFNIRNDGGATYLYGLAANYQLMNLTGVVDLNMYDPVHVIGTADYVQNVGYSRSAVLAKTGSDLEPQTTGYMVRLAVGMPTMLLRNDWQLSLAYRYLEADAVVDAFTDSDFHLGGTNNKGYVVGMQYGLGRNTWLTARWLSSNEVSGPPLAVNVLQVYLNAKF
jgi:hypothetical protein